MYRYSRIGTPTVQLTLSCTSRPCIVSKTTHGVPGTYHLEPVSSYHALSVSHVFHVLILRHEDKAVLHISTAGDSVFCDIIFLTFELLRKIRIGISEVLIFMILPSLLLQPHLPAHLLLYISMLLLWSCATSLPLPLFPDLQRS